MGIQQLLIGEFGAVGGYEGYRVDTNFTAGTNAGYDGYGAAIMGSIDDTSVIGADYINLLADGPGDTEFLVAIARATDPGEGFITDALLDEVSIWGDYISYDYGVLGPDYAVWRFAPQGIVSTTEYHIQLHG